MKKENIIALKLVTGELIVAFCESTDDTYILIEPVIYEESCSDYLYFTSENMVEIPRSSVVFGVPYDVLSISVLQDYLDYIESLNYVEVNGEFKI